MRKQNYIILVLLGAYLLSVMVMRIAGRYAIMWKTIIVPLLYLVALLSKRGKEFIKDWAVYLSLVILFDSFRGFIFAIITRFELPIYINYVISAEQMIGGNKIYPTILQNIFQNHSFTYMVDRIFIIIHSSHFFAFLVFGMIVWLVKPTEFKKHTLSMVLLMYTGILIYFIIPTIPPWMAANMFQVIPPVKHISASIYNMTIPSLFQSFDVNPIAAMPSLHAAFPFLNTLIAFRVFRKQAWTMVVYTVSVFIAIIYLGEHYLVDVFAGILLAIFSFIAIYKLPFHKYMTIVKIKQFVLKFKKCVPIPMTFTRTLLLATLLILISECIGFITVTIRRPFHVTPAFILNELKDNRKVANVFLFKYALDHSRFKENVTPIYTLMNNSHENINMSMIQDLVAKHPADPEPYFWMLYFKYKKGLIDKQQVANVIGTPNIYPDKKRADFFKNILNVLIQIN